MKPLSTSVSSVIITPSIFVTESKERKLAKDAKKNPKAFYGYMKKKTGNRVSVGPLKDSAGH